MKTYFVYMMANKSNSVLYVGVTSDLVRRVEEHKSGKVEGFTKKYKCHKLVWYTSFDYANDAIEFEKRIKKWKRAYKENLINEVNPDWRDLSTELL
ncbi:MAG: GIY-YIG nuclease family protein [candidate division KSB1 bacterium]|nr:GIY-YIG nuclease family protein [candidate division KSB1 bacterium]MDQ7064995.1 GIY-YIG nuclease family protein [candidate division KSB1 bacterium]